MECGRAPAEACLSTREQPLVPQLCPSPGADVAGLSPVPAQMWRGRAQSRRRCGRGEPLNGATWSMLCLIAVQTMQPIVALLTRGGNRDLRV